MNWFIGSFYFRGDNLLKDLPPPPETCAQTVIQESIFNLRDLPFLSLLLMDTQRRRN